MKIEVYSRAYCTSCSTVKTLLSSMGYDYTEYKVEQNTMKAELLQRYPDARTVPQVFINDERIGGYEDTYEYLTKLGVDNETTEPSAPDRAAVA